MELLDGQDVNINKALLCQLCNFKSNNVLDMIRHNKSIRHIQIEQIYCLQRRCESLESMDLSDIYQLVDGEEFLSKFIEFSLNLIKFFRCQSRLTSRLLEGRRKADN